MANSKANGFITILIKSFTERGQVALSIFVDFIFVIFCVLIAWLLNKLLEYFELKGADKFSINIIQWVSAISLIGVSLIFAIKDIIILLIRSYYEIKEEIENVSKKSP